MRSIQEELRAIQPIALDATRTDANRGEPQTDEPNDWEVVARMLGRLGKQQLRANQNAELLAADLRTALDHANGALQSLREQSDEYRRRVQNLESEARETREATLAIIDALDDLAAIARQKTDAQWTSRVDRLTARTLSVFAQVGLTELVAVGEPFDERVHEIVGTVERGERDSDQVVEMVRRGFTYQGTVLRRAQILTTR